MCLSIFQHILSGSMEDEDEQLLMMIEEIKEGREDLERMLEP